MASRMASPKTKTAASPRSAARRARAPGAVRRVERKRRVRLDTDERRAQLVALARRVFTERAYDDVSIEELATTAGISKGLLYHYFPTKRDLYVAGLRDISQGLVAAVAAVVDRDLAPLERVRAGLEAYLTTVESAGASFVALMRGGIGSDPEVAAVLEQTRQAFLKRFLDRTAVEQRMADEPVLRLAARGWIGLVEAVSIEWVSKPEVPRDTVREMLVAHLAALMAGAANRSVAKKG
jgi:AcrR family transcriptional regulator